MPKVLIEIKDNIYHAIHNGMVRNGGMESAIAMDAISSGIILTDLTNGEVIQKMFPKVEYIGENTHAIYLSYGGDESEIIALELAWWNRKWGE